MKNGPLARLGAVVVLHERIDRKVAWKSGGWFKSRDSRPAEMSREKKAGPKASLCQRQGSGNKKKEKIATNLFCQ